MENQFELLKKENAETNLYKIILEEILQTIEDEYCNVTNEIYKKAENELNSMNTKYIDEEISNEISDIIHILESEKIIKKDGI